MSGKKKKSAGTRDDSLKIVGILIMIIDHVGMLLFPQIIVLRVIGRLAFPIFAYYLTEGYVHTSNLGKYLFRLFAFAIIAQFPFYLATGTTRLNVFFSFFVGLLAIHAYKKRKYLTLLSIILISAIIPMDFSSYGILVMLSFYIFKEKRFIFFSQFAINFVTVLITGGFIQPFSLIGTLIVLYYPKDLPKLHINKYFFYAFYPAHLVIIYCISKLPFFSQ